MSEHLTETVQGKVFLSRKRPVSWDHGDLQVRKENTVTRFILMVFGELVLPRQHALFSTMMGGQQWLQWSSTQGSLLED